MPDPVTNAASVASSQLLKPASIPKRYEHAQPERSRPATLGQTDPWRQRILLRELRLPAIPYHRRQGLLLTAENVGVGKDPLPRRKPRFRRGLIRR